MQVKSGTVFVIFLVLGVLAGDASACINGEYHFKCTFGVVLRAWGSRGGRCVVNSSLYRPSTCAGCEIYTGNGFIRVTTATHTHTCSYAYGHAHACQAYCTNILGGIAYGWYECFTQYTLFNACTCKRSCQLNN